MGEKRRALAQAHLRRARRSQAIAWHSSKVAQASGMALAIMTSLPVSSSSANEHALRASATRASPASRGNAAKSAIGESLRQFGGINRIADRHQGPKSGRLIVEASEQLLFSAASPALQHAAQHNAASGASREISAYHFAKLKRRMKWAAYGEISARPRHRKAGRPLAVTKPHRHALIIEAARAPAQSASSAVNCGDNSRRRGGRRRQCLARV